MPESTARGTLSSGSQTNTRSSVVWDTEKTKMKLISLSREGAGPGPVVMGGDSRFEGRGFESQCRILDGHFSH